MTNMLMSNLLCTKKVIFDLRYLPKFSCKALSGGKFGLQQNTSLCLISIALKAPVTTAADDILNFFFFF